MKNFMIGHYGNFDYDKHVRDFKNEFYGVEACLFGSEKDVENLIKESTQTGFSVGIHFPLRAGVSELRDPQFLSLDKMARAEAFRHMEDEFNYCKRLKPKYILFHYPKPVILDDKVDWLGNGWRFASKSEYVFESEFPLKTFIEYSEDVFKWLSEKGEQYNFTPVLELDAINRYIYETDLLQELLDKYPKVRLCIDTLRLHVQDLIDPNFNAIDILRKYTKYADVIHLSNVSLLEGRESSHYPALPDLKPEDGWAPIEDYIKVIAKENKNVKIMFEHRSDLISNEELEKCYNWVNELLELTKKPVKREENDFFGR